MLKERRCPLVVALNKIDVCYNWKADPGAPFLTTYNNQEKATKNDFETVSPKLLEFVEQGEMHNYTQKINEWIEIYH